MTHLSQLMFPVGLRPYEEKGEAIRRVGSVLSVYVAWRFTASSCNQSGFQSFCPLLFAKQDGTLLVAFWMLRMPSGCNLDVTWMSCGCPVDVFTYLFPSVFIPLIKLHLNFTPFICLDLSTAVASLNGSSRSSSTSWSFNGIRLHPYQTDVIIWTVLPFKNNSLLIS